MVIFHVVVVVDVGAECFLPVARNCGGWRERQEAFSLSPTKEILVGSQQDSPRLSKGP